MRNALIPLTLGAAEFISNNHGSIRLSDYQHILTLSDTEPILLVELKVVLEKPTKNDLRQE